MSRSAEFGRSQDAGSGALGAFLSLAVLVAFLSFASVDADSGELHTQAAPPCEDVTATHAPDDFAHLLCEKVAPTSTSPSS